MTKLQEPTDWSDEIYQFETSDPVIGGPDGIDNLQAKQLAGRTNWLRRAVNTLQDWCTGHLGESDPHSQYLHKSKGGTVAGVIVAKGSMGVLKASNGGGTGQTSIFLTREGATGPYTTWEHVHIPDGGYVLRAVNADYSKNKPTFSLGVGADGEPYVTRLMERGGRVLINGAPDDSATSLQVKGLATFDTPATGDKSRRGATTEFVATALAALVSGAPDQLDTLRELADALGGDANFSATVLSKIAEKASISALDDYPKAYSILALPAKDVGPITVREVGEVWVWSSTQYFKGYRSPLCGRPVDGHTLTPLASEIDAVGGTLSKTAYAALWGYAQENGLVVQVASWSAGMHRFVDLGGDNFRVPDLRNQFRRYTGTDADTANARTLGSYKADTLQGHEFSLGPGGANIFAFIGGGDKGPSSGGETYTTFSKTSGAVSDGKNGTPRVGKETSPVHTAYAPRIHV